MPSLTFAARKDRYHVYHSLQTPRHRGPRLVQEERCLVRGYLTSSGDVEQHATPGNTVAGALVVRTTVAVDPARTEAGVTLNAWDAAAGEWVPVDRSEFEIGIPGQPGGHPGQRTGEGSELVFACQVRHS